MTMRDYMNRSKRRFLALFILTGFLMAVGLAAWEERYAWGRLLFFGGLAAIVANILHAFWIGFRCPHCRQPLFTLVFHGGWSPFSMHSKMRFCPFCAHDVDSELESRYGKKQKDGTLAE